MVDAEDEGRGLTNYPHLTPDTYPEGAADLGGERLAHGVVRAGPDISIMGIFKRRTLFDRRLPRRHHNDWDTRCDPAGVRYLSDEGRL